MGVQIQEKKMNFQREILDLVVAIAPLASPVRRMDVVNAIVRKGYDKKPVSNAVDALARKGLVKKYASRRMSASHKGMKLVADKQPVEPTKKFDNQDLESAVSAMGRLAETNVKMRDALTQIRTIINEVLKE